MRVPGDNTGDGSHKNKPACRLEKAAAKLNWLEAGLLLHGCKIYLCLYANFLVKIILNIHNSDN